MASMTVNKTGPATSKPSATFKNYQLHIEWKIPENITGTGPGARQQRRLPRVDRAGRRGLRAAGAGLVQQQDLRERQAGSIYKQAFRWRTPMPQAGRVADYDVAWTAPTFNADGSLKTPAYVTVFFNGVLVQNHFELKGETLYIGKPFYKKYDTAPIKLQAHGDGASRSASGISGCGSCRSTLWRILRQLWIEKK